MTTSKLTLKAFKDEFRFICTDTWGDSMDCWFEATGRLYIKHQVIPGYWEYSPGSNPLNNDSYFSEMFKNASINDLWTIAHFMFRYCRYLDYKGLKY